jgi:hypothetical protein
MANFRDGGIIKYCRFRDISWEDGQANGMTRVTFFHALKCAP